MKYLLLLISFSMFSQAKEFEVLKKINGVEIFSKSTITKSTEKKDTWIVEFEFRNVTDHDIYYKSIVQQPTNMEKLAGEKEKNVVNFATISIENSNAMSFISDQYAFLIGDRIRLRTDNNENIYVIKHGKTYTNSMDFRSNKGIEPILSIQIINSISFTESFSDFY
ncbi:MAG TPA: hypothetical protein VK528_11195 [Flavobacterium sp.]|nr:hypothetical protein [Flavobacterium sp.]